MYGSWPVSFSNKRTKTQLEEQSGQQWQKLALLRARSASITFGRCHFTGERQKSSASMLKLCRNLTFGSWSSPSCPHSACVTKVSSQSFLQCKTSLTPCICSLSKAARATEGRFLELESDTHCQCHAPRCCSVCGVTSSGSKRTCVIPLRPQLVYQADEKNAVNFKARRVCS